MTVGAISSTTTYTGNYQLYFFPVSVSTDRLNQLMQDYGVKKSGDEYTDMKNLYQAMYNYYSQTAAIMNNSQSQQVNNPNNLPWAPLMQQVGLTPTGDLEKDYSNFMNKITSLELTTTDKTQQAKLQEEEKQGQYVFTQGLNGQAQGTGKASGADIVAMMNQAFIVGKY